MTTSFEPSLIPGALVRGRWNQTAYRVERLLGGGANGKVYLVRKGNQTFAMKIGFNAMDLQSEVNVLRSLSQSSASFRNYLVDVDDMAVNGQPYPFLVIRYVRGVHLKQYVQQHGTDWLPMIGTQLLKKLSELHRHGYAFCDLKAENMLVSGYGDVNLIDFGGVTALGRSVRQFTEVFDRGFWCAGTRTADEAYDLFSFAVLMISVAENQYGKLKSFTAMLPQNRDIDSLLEFLQDSASLKQLAPVLRKALLGQYRSSLQALEEWRQLSLTNKPAAGKRMAAAKQTGWLKICFAASLALFAAAVFLAWPLF